LWRAPLFFFSSRRRDRGALPCMFFCVASSLQTSCAPVQPVCSKKEPLVSADAWTFVPDRFFALAGGTASARCRL
jgi:hypothetical protein